jgi:AraC-like DNA-binding protein
MLNREAGGQFFFADDSLPDNLESTWIGGGEGGWRCQSIPRLHLLLEGEHALTFVRHGLAETVRLKPGDVWFFPADAHDNERFATSCRYAAAIFQATFTRFIVVDFEAMAPGKRRAGVRKTLVHHWHEDRPPHVLSVLESLTQILSRRPDGKRGVAEGLENTDAGYYLARGLWVMLYGWICETVIEPAPLGKAHASWLGIDRFLQENYHRPLNRQQVADAVGLHPNRVSVLCAEFAGKSFREIVEKRRLKQAMRFLESSDHKIETISALCGYVSAAYFSRTFRRVTGVTPGRWRLDHRKETKDSP